METKKKTAEEIQDVLDCFVGTFGYHTHQLGNQKLLLTDGCDYVRREAQAFWLFDLILSHQMSKSIQEIHHQVWKLKKQPDETWLMNCEDGNKNLILSQKIEFSDFPLPEISIWVLDGVALLPSEY